MGKSSTSGSLCRDDDTNIKLYVQSTDYSVRIVRILGYWMLPSPGLVGTPVHPGFWSSDPNTTPHINKVHFVVEALRTGNVHILFHGGLAMGVKGIVAMLRSTGCSVSITRLYYCPRETTNLALVLFPGTTPVRTATRLVTDDR